VDEQGHMPWLHIQVSQSRDCTFSEVYLREPMLMALPTYFLINEARGFPGMIGSIDVCIGSGRTSLLHDKDSIVSMQRNELLFLSLLHHKIYWFGALSLAQRVSIMTSTCSSALRYSLGLQKAMLQWFDMRWMANNITTATI
jgi:hypothetical protein